MNRLNRTAARLAPFAFALSLALVLPGIARAQAAAAAPAAATADVPLTAAERQQLVGNYLLGMAGSADRAMPFRVYEEKGVLYGQPQGGQAKRLVHRGGKKFHPEGEPESVVTFTVKEGQATRFKVATPHGDIEGERENRAGRS